MNELSLFTGAGGGLLASKLLGWRSIGYVEIDDFCQQILAARIRDGILDEAPIFSNIEAFNSEFARSYRGLVDVITAAPPCQPWSVVGRRAGEKDARNLWPETLESLRLVRPRFLFMENVPALIASQYFGRILGDLAESGYNAKWRVLSASSVGAPHIRKRLWLLATDANRKELWEQSGGGARENRKSEALS